MKESGRLGSLVGLCCALLGTGACAARTTTGEPVTRQDPPDHAPPTPPPPVTEATGGDGASGSAASPSPPTMEVEFARELDQPVSSIALGQRRVAALANVPFLRERDGRWRPIPLPAGLDSAPRQALTIYMGRDDRPRLMGHSWAGEPADRTERRPVYLRYLERGWTPAWEEIGRLGGARPGALFGVLGYDDPEVVCKEAEGCVVKRVSGWTSIAPTELGPVRLAGQGVFGLPASGLTRLTATGFVDAKAELPPGEVRDIWEIEAGELLAIVARDGRTELVHVRGSRTETAPPPIAEPRVLWASGARDLWLAGDGGLAWFDGERWRQVVGPEPPLSCLVGRGDDTLWVGGARGLFRRLTHPGATPPPG